MLQVGLVLAWSKKSHGCSDHNTVTAVGSNNASTTSYLTHEIYGLLPVAITLPANISDLPQGETLVPSISSIFILGFRPSM